MGPQISRWYEDSAVAAMKLAHDDATVAAARRAFSDIARRAVPQASAREMNILIRSAEAEFRRLRRGGKLNFAAMERAANEMDRRLQMKAKLRLVSEALAEPCVFYAVSTHQKPRDGHAELQGSVLYDRNFRQKLPWYRVRDVERHIRRTGMMSVQEAVRSPTYLIVAPYCRHRLIPLQTDEVLAGIADTVYRDGAHRTRTDAQRYREYRDRRRRIAVRAERKIKKLRLR